MSSHAIYEMVDFLAQNSNPSKNIYTKLNKNMRYMKKWRKQVTILHMPWQFRS